jgi:hypothetical protein
MNAAVLPKNNVPVLTYTKENQLGFVFSISSTTALRLQYLLKKPVEQKDETFLLSERRKLMQQSGTKPFRVDSTGKSIPDTGKPIFQNERFIKAAKLITTGPSAYGYNNLNVVVVQKKSGKYKLELYFTQFGTKTRLSNEVRDAINDITSNVYEYTHAFENQHGDIWSVMFQFIGPLGTEFAHFKELEFRQDKHIYWLD